MGGATRFDQFGNGAGWSFEVRVRKTGASRHANVAGPFAGDRVLKIS